MNTKLPQDTTPTEKPPSESDNAICSPLKSISYSKDILNRLQMAIAYRKNSKCDCDTDVGMVCEYCGEYQLLVDAKKEIKDLRKTSQS